MFLKKVKFRNPWAWIPSLYFAQGLPYIVVMTVSVVMYKRMGVSNADIALYTSWLYLPWVIKPLWSPIVDLLKTKRLWIVVMQLLVGAGLGGVALTIPLPTFFQFTLGFFWLLAFSSATHDIAADGFYMLGLTEHQQAWFVGVRSSFYRLAMITGQGLLIILAGFIESNSGLPTETIVVQSKPDQSIQSVMHPDSLELKPKNGEIRVLTYPREVEMNTEPISKAKVDSVVDIARQWNIDNEFYTQQEQINRGKDQQVAKEDKSFWAAYISDPLENTLKDLFGPEQELKKPTDRAGNVATIFFRLSQEPTENQVVVNFGRESGDKSLELIEGTRFVFTEENWDKPAMAIVQADPKLDFATSATFKARAGNIPLSWMVTFGMMAILFLIFFAYHGSVLPYPDADKPAARTSGTGVLKEFFQTFALFFKKDRIGIIVAFLLLYRFGEAQIVKMASPFLLDAQEAGGLALTTGEVGFVYGTVGLLALTIGGILGGIMAARHGLKFWLWPMIISMNLPNAVYIYLSSAMPESILIINIAIIIEQFGYGFGFTAYMLYMIYVSEGDHKTAHYAITTGFMALGMMLPGMISGWIQEIVGYQNFFIWVIIASIPIFIVAYFVPIDPEFGKRKEGGEEEEEGSGY